MASTSATDSTDEAMLAAVTTALACDDVAALATLTRAATSLAVLEACCEAFVNCATAHKSDELVSGDVLRDAFGALVHALCAQPADKPVVVACLRLLLHWLDLKHPQTAVLAGEAGAVGAVVAAMCCDTADRGMQERGCRVLAALFADTPQNLQLADDAQAVAAVLTAMRVHPNCEDVQLSACYALELATDDIDVDFPGAVANANAAVALGAVELLAPLLPGSDEELSAVACHVLAKLVALRDGKERAMRCGAFGDVLQTMRVHAASADLQHFGCTVLGRMGGDDDAVATATLSAAHEVISCAMRLFPEHVDLQKSACYALSNLFSYSYDGMKHADAVLCVVNVLHAHADDVDVLESACDALARLTESQPANTAEACRVGALPALIRSLRMHPTRNGSDETCLLLLSRLTDSNAAIELQGGVPAPVTYDCIALSRAVVAAMQDNPDTFDIQDMGCGILRGMVMLAQPACTKNADAVLKAGGFEVVNAAMQTFIEKQHFVANLCFLLGELAYRASFELFRVVGMRAIDAGAIDAVVAAMRRHTTDAGVQEYAAYALTWLCSNLADDQAEGLAAVQGLRMAAERAVSCGAIQLLVEALRTHGHVRSVKLHATSAICALSAAVHVFTASAAAAAGSIVAEVLMDSSAAHADLTCFACFALPKLVSCAASNINVADAVALPLNVMKHSVLSTRVAVSSSVALLAVIQISTQHAAEAARRGAAAAVRDAARWHPGSEELQSSAFFIVSLLARVNHNFSHAMPAAATPHAREEAERRAEAMAAALIAEEEEEAAARTARSPVRSSKSGKKKRAGAGGGAAGSGDTTPSVGAKPAAAQAAASASEPLAKLSLDECADSTNAPSAAAMRRRRRAAAKAARRQTAGTAEASDGEDDEAKGASAADSAAAVLSNDAGSGDDEDAAAAPVAAVALMAALRSPPAPVLLPASLPPLPMAAAATQHGDSASAPTPPVSLKECCVFFIDIPAAERVVLVPCGHRSMCEECWRERLLPREPAARLCPICHTPAASAMRVFDT